MKDCETVVHLRPRALIGQSRILVVYRNQCKRYLCFVGCGCNLWVKHIMFLRTKFWRFAFGFKTKWTENTAYNPSSLILPPAASDHLVAHTIVPRCSCNYTNCANNIVTFMFPSTNSAGDYKPTGRQNVPIYKPVPKENGLM